MPRKTITRRTFMQTLGTGAAALSLPLAQCSKNKRLPNIILILADDMGYGDLSCLNRDSKIPTPNMDRIAGEGVLLTDAHSGSAVCTPTRYGLLTGQYCWRTELKKGVLWGYDPLLVDVNRMTLALLLKQNGYATAGIGKWHLGLGAEKPVDYSKPLRPGPNELGFDYYFGIPASLDMEPYLYFENDHVVGLPIEVTGGGNRDSDGYWLPGQIMPGFRHLDVLPTLTQKATAFLDNHAASKPGVPLFLYFPLSAPHDPWVPTPEFVGKSKAGRYGDFVTQVDGTVGQILQTLKRLEMAENTLIIVTSDNGADVRFLDPAFCHKSNYNFRGQKSDIWDGGHRIPFIARWPKHIKPGSVCSNLFCLTDMLATVAAIVGVELPADAGEDSYNQLSVLLDRAPITPVREAVVHHSSEGMFAIRKGNWKLIAGRGSGGWSDRGKQTDPPGQLYDMSADINERQNLYETHPDIVKELTALLDHYIHEGRSR